MSNGDDVVDNWEEIDEAKLNTLKTLSTSSCNSTFESITTKTSYHNLTTNSSAASAIFTTTSNTVTNTSTSASRPITQMKLLQRSNNQDSNASVKSSNAKSPLDDMSATFQPVMMVLHKPQDEYQSANYTAPIANQTVKILRRPTQSTEPRNNGIRPKQPIKTLQQREQEYAEARLRILGSAKNPEDEEQKTSTTTTTTITTSTTNSTPSTPTATVAALSNSNMTNMVSNAKQNSPKIQGNVVNTNQYNNHYNQQLQQQQQQQYQQNYQQQQQQQQNYYYNQQQQQQSPQQQQQPQSPAYNNNRTYNMNPLLGLGPMGPLGPPAQYQITTQTQQVQQQQQQQHLKYQQYHQKSPQQQHKSQQQHQQTWSPVVGGSVSSPSLLRQQQNDTILRLPRGPDGTAGFQMRR